MKRLGNLLKPELIVDLQAEEKFDAIKELSEVISKADQVSDGKVFLKEIIKREKMLSTGIGFGIAVPHVKIDSVSDFVVAIGRSKKGIEFEAIDDKPVKLIVMIGASESQAKEYLKLLAQLVLRLKRKEIRKSIMEAKSPEEIISIFLSTAK